MADEKSEYDFELDLNFEGHKNPVEAFGQMAKMYERLITIDKHILYNILPSAKLEYELADIEFSSIKSFVIQVLKGIPDDILKDITNPGKLLGHALVKIKHRILKAVETNEVQPNGMIWVSWYKKSAKIATDITENFIRNTALKNGLVDIKVCAVDDKWSGLKLVIPVKDRK
jgi:hypothetical protein